MGLMEDSILPKPSVMENMVIFIIPAGEYGELYHSWLLNKWHSIVLIIRMCLGLIILGLLSQK